MRKATTFLTVILIAIIFIACSSTKTYEETTTTTEFETPFKGSKYQSDENNFRAKQSGESPDLATAKKIAVLNAKTEMAGLINTTIKSVTEQYTNQRSIENKQEYENKFEELVREVVNLQLTDVKIFDDKTYQKKDGGYMVWVALEASKDEVLNGINNSISNNKKLQLDYDKHLFEKIYQEEMKKFQNE